MINYAERKMVARELLSFEPKEEAAGISVFKLAAFKKKLNIEFPEGKAPVPAPLSKPPSPYKQLPKADIVVVTWTVAEQNALCDVLTPGYGRGRWYDYKRLFKAKYYKKIRNGAPSRNSGRLGSWMMTKIADKNVLCFKSELHLNQDGIRTGDGTATLPVKDLFRQIIDETGAKCVLTTGTSGGVFPDHELGDVVVTRGAKFRLDDEFRKEPFNGKFYKSAWTVPDRYFDCAVRMMKVFADNIQDPLFGPPTKRYPFGDKLIEPPKNEPNIYLDNDKDMPEFHPILTTDYFEFGTSSNRLDQYGCAVEMGDAVLGLVCSEMKNPPDWAVIRNLSDPVINGDLPQGKPVDMQIHWAVWYYEEYGYWTSVNSALAVWAIIAGL